MFCSLAGLAVPSAAHAAKGDNDKISLSNEPRRCSQGTQLSFWEDDQGTLWADLTETFDGFSKTYEGLVVVADPDVSLDLDKLNQLSETDQKRSVHVTLRKNLSEKNLLALENRFPGVEITGAVHLGKEGLKGGARCMGCHKVEVGYDKFCRACAIDKGYNICFTIGTCGNMNVIGLQWDGNDFVPRGNTGIRLNAVDAYRESEPSSCCFGHTHPTPPRFPPY